MSPQGSSSFDAGQETRRRCRKCVARLPTAAHWSLGKKLGQSKRSECVGGAGGWTLVIKLCGIAASSQTHTCSQCCLQSRNTSQDCLHLSWCFTTEERKCSEWWPDGGVGTGSAHLRRCAFSVNADVQMNDRAETWRQLLAQHSAQKLELNLWNPNGWEFDSDWRPPPRFSEDGLEEVQLFHFIIHPNSVSAPLSSWQAVLIWTLLLPCWIEPVHSNKEGRDVLRWRNPIPQPSSS